MDSLSPRYRGGRPRRITTEQRQRIVSVAGARPDSQGVPLTRWSLPRLCCASRRRGDRRSRRAISARCWPRPGCRSSAPAPGRPAPTPTTRRRRLGSSSCASSRRATAPVVSFDQMGPVSLRPTPGAGWAPQGQPERQRADYNRRAGIRYVFGAYDVHADRLRVRLRPQAGRQRHAQLHAPDPRSPTRPGGGSTGSRTTCRRTGSRRSASSPPATGSSSSPTPTYASYLNPVECHFSALTEFVVSNADYLDWDAFGYALARHVRYRNSDHRDHRLAAAEHRHRIAA